MKKAFRITPGSVAAPLSFDEVRAKYGASAEDVRVVKLFIAGLPTTIRTRSSSNGFRSRSARVAGTRKK